MTSMLKEPKKITCFGNLCSYYPVWAAVIHMAHTAKQDMNYGLWFEACCSYSLLTFTICYRFRSAASLSN